MTWLRSILMGVAFAALFYSVPARSALEMIPLTGDAIHPCGGVGLELRSITQYFQYRWNAGYRDLSDEEIQEWIAYHELDGVGITTVRLFRSPVQPVLAGVSARRFVNYLDGKPLVDLMCVVKLDGKLAMEYTSKQLQEILEPKGSKI